VITNVVGTIVDATLVTTVSVGVGVAGRTELALGLDAHDELTAHMVPVSKSWTDDRSEVRRPAIFKQAAPGCYSEDLRAVRIHRIGLL
jgi:hypothetical protein